MKNAEAVCSGPDGVMDFDPRNLVIGTKLLCRTGVNGIRKHTVFDNFPIVSSGEVYETTLTDEAGLEWFPSVVVCILTFGAIREVASSDCVPEFVAIKSGKTLRIHYVR